jgi:hypothetical protein
MGPYDIEFRRRLDAFSPGLSSELARVPDLAPAIGEAVLAYLLREACAPTNIHPILLGRKAVSEIPRGWVLARLESVARRACNLADEWEYRRLLELCLELDRGLTERFVKSGLASSNPEVVEAAGDFRERLGAQ